MNPAVTFSMYLTGKITTVRMLIYWIAQFFGSFLAAVVIYINYYNKIDTLGRDKDGILTLESAAIFATYPQFYLTIATGFFDQVIGTGLLVVFVLAITDKKNEVYSHGASFALVGIFLFVQGAAFSENCGGAINPARDFGPRLFTLMAGWGDKVFSAGNYFFWVPIVGPMIGSLFGTLFYTILFGNNWS